MTATGPIATFSTIVAGSGYYDNTYATVRLLGGNGSLAYANITVSSGAVTAVALPSPTAHQILDRTGKNYQVGDVLSLYDLTALGPGSGFTVSVATLASACENCTYGKIIPYTSTLGGQRFCGKDAYANIAGPQRDYESVIVPDDYFCGEGANITTGVSFSSGVQGPPGPSGAGYTATSTTSLVVTSSASRAFTTQTNLAYTTGARIRATSAGSGNWMEGVVTNYASTTLTATMDLSDGTAGTHADWDINLAGQRGLQGTAGVGTTWTYDSTGTYPTPSGGSNGDFQANGNGTGTTDSYQFYTKVAGVWQKV